MFRTVLVAALLVLTLPRTTLAAWGEVDTGFSVGGWMNLWSNVWAPIPGALMVDSEDRIVTVAQDGTGTLRLLRTFDNGTVDTSFGFLGSVSLSVPGASSARVVRLLPGVGNGVVAVGNAELVDGSWIVVFRLDEDGSLDEKFGEDGFLWTRGGGVTLDTYVGDAALNGTMNEMLELRGWFAPPPPGVEFAFLLILDLAAGGQMADYSPSLPYPSVSERWLRLADSAASGTCLATLAERDGVLSVFGYLTGTPQDCGDPTFTLPLTLPGAPGATLRAAGIVRAGNGDFVIAAWVESGLPTKPTAYFRTLGATANLRTTWGNQGIAWVDSTSPGHVGFRAARLLYDPWTGDVLSIGTELGTGGPFGTVDRVRAARLLADNGALDPTVPTAGVTGPDSGRHHRVRDVAIVPGTSRPVAAVSTHLTDGFDVPESWVVGLRSVEDLFRDGFESGGTGTWSLTLP
ncbi:MAG: hypothetical protein F9K16_13440 [Thermoanaerobaculia bacterium]|nr:MAG: hypothetical protein F9K16_13440 [Thermoanaerobaculia bacterium]